MFFSPALLVAFVMLSQLICVDSFNLWRSSNLKEKYVGWHRLPANLKKNLSENGLAGDAIGYVAPPTEECGVVHFDYSGYEDGSLFRKTCQPYVDKLKELTKNQEFLLKLVEEDFNFMVEEHKKDMKEVFDDIRGRVPTSPELKRNLGKVPQLFDGIAIIEFAVGFLWEAGGRLFDHFFGDEAQRMDDLNKLWEHNKKTFGKLLNDTTKTLMKDIYSNRVSGVLNFIRQEYVETVKNGLQELLEHDILNPAFTGCDLGRKRVTAGSTVWSAIGQLFGDKFPSSVLARKGCDSMAVIKASVAAMSRKHMRVNLCYPTASEREVVPLLKVEALGKFIKQDDGTDIFRFPHVHPLYAIPENCESVGCLVKIAEETCSSFSELHLCSLSHAKDTCPLERSARTDCLFTDKVVLDKEKFVFTRSILETTIIATKALRGTVIYSDGTLEKRNFNSSVVAIVLPADSRMDIQGTIITSRIWTADGKIDVTDLPEVPALPDEKWPGLPNYTKTTHGIAISVSFILLVSIFSACWLAKLWFGK